MSSAFFSFGSSRIHYFQWGRGEKILLCFHGYGESAASFGFLSEALGQDFTILAIDLPYHGETQWRGGLYLDPRDLLEIMNGIVAAASPGGSGGSGGTVSSGGSVGSGGLGGSVRSGGSGGSGGLGGSDGAGGSDGSGGPGGAGGSGGSGGSSESADWSLLGYSMGGRLALQLLELAPSKMRRLVLLATDGLQMNFWYWLATQTTAGNALFRWTMKRPAWLFFLLRTGHVLRVVNPSIYKFTAHYVDDARVRENLYARWTTMRGFRPDLAAVGRSIRQYEIPVRLLYGSYDRIIRWERGERFRRSNAAYCSLTLLPAGHQLLQAKFLEVIVKALYLPTI
jgi:pimeloyl-ACP methyl ester carboxylesterase